MIKLYSPDNESELALLKSLLKAEGIYYYVLNDHFGTLRVGPKIDPFNAKTIYVREESYESAKEIIDDFLESIKDESKNEKSGYSTPDKIRMVLEALLFSWFIPGNKWKKGNKSPGEPEQ
jgi:hypothetical protein